ncbi:hypothetical protein JTB14_030708 [Gonioctena quinquepunctata]|nr:hypothetical protein JTB14_030708 [Gonioctena quinquepunctata]
MVRFLKVLKLLVTERTQTTFGDRYRALYTNFAKYLNPTPTKLELFDNVIWPKVKPDDFQFLNINKTLTIEKNPKAEVYSKWVEIYENMAVKPYDTF